MAPAEDDDDIAQAITEVLGPPLAAAAARIEELFRDPETDDPDGAPSAS